MSQNQLQIKQIETKFDEKISQIKASFENQNQHIQQQVDEMKASELSTKSIIAKNLVGDVKKEMDQKIDTKTAELVTHFEKQFRLFEEKIDGQKSSDITAIQTSITEMTKSIEALKTEIKTEVEKQIKDEIKKIVDKHSNDPSSPSTSIFNFLG